MSPDRPDRDGPLADMGIEPDRAAAAANMLEAVANTSLAEVERAHTSSGSEKVREETIEQPAEWARTIDGAANLQEAAQWALYLDIERGRSIMQRAGFLYYRSLGHAFGVYLLVVAGSAAEMMDRRDFDELITQLEITSDLRRPSSDKDRDSSDARDPAVPSAMWHPQQQAYGLLAVAGEPRIAEQFSSRIRSLAFESPHSRGVAPVGATGTPLRYIWEIAGLMLDDREDTVNRLVVHLARMAGRYEQAMELARVNQYLWTNCLAPVDVADLDIIGITALAVRRFGPFFIDVLTDRLEGLGPVARAPIEIGRSLA